jgi:hypothetical protein
MAGTSRRSKKQSARDLQKGRRPAAARPSRRRSRAVTTALKREGRSAASHRALARQAKSAARRRSAKGRKK